MTTKTQKSKQSIYTHKRNYPTNQQNYFFLLRQKENYDKQSPFVSKTFTQSKVIKLLENNNKKNFHENKNDKGNAKCSVITQFHENGFVSHGGTVRLCAGIYFL